MTDEPDKVEPDDLWRAAIHEAGHVVLGELLSMTTEYVAVEPNDKMLAHVQRRPPSPLATLSGETHWRFLLIDCAGVIAEGMFFDGFMSYDVLSEVLPEDEISDTVQLWAYLESHSEDKKQQLKWFELAYAQAQRILSNSAVRRSVESLAARLVEKRTLDQSEVYGVLKAALGRSKWGRDRFEMSERYAVPPRSWIDSREGYRMMAEAMAEL